MLRPMKRRSFSSWPCSVARAVDILGDGWTLLVLRELFYGETRFEGFIEILGIARNTLTERLHRLCDAGIVMRVAYQVDPLRHDYVLTERGRDFFGVMAAIQSWGDKWLSDENGLPIMLKHNNCGHDTQALVVCSQCGDELRIDDIRAHVGPGYPTRLLENDSIARRFANDAATENSPSRAGDGERVTGPK